MCEGPTRRCFPPDRLADAVGADLPLIDATRDPIIVGAGLTEVLLKEGQGLDPQIEASCDASPIHFCRRRRSNAMEFFDRQLLDEAVAHLQGDDEEAIGFVLVGGRLGRGICCS